MKSQEKARESLLDILHDLTEIRPHVLAGLAITLISWLLEGSPSSNLNLVRDALGIAIIYYIFSIWVSAPEHIETVTGLYGVVSKGLSLIALPLFCALLVLFPSFQHPILMLAIIVTVSDFFGRRHSGFDITQALEHMANRLERKSYIRSIMVEIINTLQHITIERGLKKFGLYLAILAVSWGAGLTASFIRNYIQPYTGGLAGNYLVTTAILSAPFTNDEARRTTSQELENSATGVFWNAVYESRTDTCGAADTYNSATPLFLLAYDLAPDTREYAERRNNLLSFAARSLELSFDLCADHKPDSTRAQVMSKVFEWDESVLDHSKELNVNAPSLAYLDIGWVHYMKNDYIDAENYLSMAVKLLSADSLNRDKWVNDGLFKWFSDNRKIYSLPSSYLKIAYQSRLRDAYNMLGQTYFRTLQCEDANDSETTAVALATSAAPAVPTIVAKYVTSLAGIKTTCK